MTSPTPLSITLETRFRGPTLSGNGGYTAGRLALASGLGSAHQGAPVTVTLRQPPPLDRALLVRSASTGRTGSTGSTVTAELWDDDLLVATATAGSFTSDLVGPVSFESATLARSTYQGATGHPFPGCFVCGPEREAGDGLRLSPGIVDAGHTACIWVPDPSLVTGDDPSVVGVEFGWSALDCPGGWTSDLHARPLVLGRMTAVCLSAPAVGRPHVVVGRLVGQQGRKTFTATSLYDADRLVGRAEHTWIAIDPTAFNT